MMISPEASHFMLGRNTMLDAYKNAKEHAASQQVKVDHGIIGEEIFRDWLGNFLPKKYGVTSGYIFTQNPRSPFQAKGLEHFDVIIYDQINSPTLWVEENPGKNSRGVKRAIPAEYVLSVVEIKATFSRRNLRDAFAKLKKLEPLYEKYNDPSDEYPGLLNNSFFSYIFFFELLNKDAPKVNDLSAFVQDTYLRGTPSEAFILSYEGAPNKSSGIIALTESEKSTHWRPFRSLYPGAMSKPRAHVLADMGFLSASLSWFDINFSRFAFDFLAKLEGRYNHRRLSSFHGIPKF